MPSRRVIFQTISIVVVAILVAIAILALYVYKQSVGKFEIRRLSLPTRIFTDFTPLRGGVVLGPDDLAEKLNRLGYRQVSALAQAGDYVPGSSQIDIYTRPFTHPTGQYPSQPVRVAFHSGGIASGVSLRESERIVNVAVERELMTSLAHDHAENARRGSL